MSPTQRASFDRSVDLAHQAAACSLYGFHLEASNLWLHAALFAVSLSGKKACLRNAHEEFLRVRTTRVH